MGDYDGHGQLGDGTQAVEKKDELAPEALAPVTDPGSKSELAKLDGDQKIAAAVAQMDTYISAYDRQAIGYTASRQGIRAALVVVKSFKGVMEQVVAELASLRAQVGAGSTRPPPHRRRLHDRLKPARKPGKGKKKLARRAKKTAKFGAKRKVGGPAQEPTILPDGDKAKLGFGAE